jgi:hypothetical protein
LNIENINNQNQNQNEENKKDYLLKNLYDGKSIGSLNFIAKWLIFDENDGIKIVKRKNLQYRVIQNERTNY